jgi:phage shock protein A
MKGTTLTEEEYEFLERVYLGLEQGCEYTQKRMLAIINKLEDKIACQEKALKIAIDATVVMREKIERLEKRLEDCNKGYTMASQIAAKTAKKYLDAEEKIAALGAENKELQQALRDCS